MCVCVCVCDDDDDDGGGKSVGDDDDDDTGRMDSTLSSGQGSFPWQKKIQNCTERTVGYPDNYNGKTVL